LSDLRAGLEQAFESRFGSPPRHVASAPGRVNLIGEHTDYNDGFVLPCAIGFQTLVAVSPRDDDTVLALALDWDSQLDAFSLSERIEFNETRPWCNYVRGVCFEMVSRGHTLPGCNIAITGNVPQGAGLSSSASLEIALVRALAAASGISIDGREMAIIGQAAENDFVGCACGIMDQLISAEGRAGSAVLIDCRNLELTPLAIPEKLSLLIVNSNVRRGLVDSEYNTRRKQCETAARHFGKASLRDLDLDTLLAESSGLEPVAARRARHVLEENRRVLDTVVAFRNGDIPRIGSLMAASHRSMRDLFEITTPEIDALVEMIKEVAGERGGARMTGGGFGGCVVALLEHEMLEPVCRKIEAVYPAQTGLEASLYRTVPAGGVSLLS
jgi:galactokinase